MIKMKNEKRKFKTKKSKFYILSFSFTLFAFSFAFNCYAKEITILYTGETHAMLYPCNCPKEPDGGIARRATLIKQLRKDYPDALLLDSGGFFAGGLMDEYTQNTQADMQRTIINLKAMELMKYDAVTIGDDEFNFGRKFFQENIVKTHLTLLSCNIPDLFKPYIIKEISGIKIGIIGVTTLSARQKAEGLKFIEPKAAVASAVTQLRKDNVNIIVLLSHLGESEDLNLINDIQGIDLLITGHSRAKDEPFTKIANTLVLRPSWEGRRLGKVTFTVERDKIKEYKVEELRLSDQIRDDPDILSILPPCFSDANCTKEGREGICQNPGSLNSNCLFSEANKVNLLIITDKDCIACDTEMMVDSLKKFFPGLYVSYLYYPDEKAKNMVNDFGIFALPAYFLGKEAEKEKNFDRLKANLELKANLYMLRPLFSGFSYLIGRKRIKGNLELFISLYDKTTPELLDAIKEYNPKIHFLAVEREGKFDAPKGNLEVEDGLRAVCVQKYYPQKFWDYISCRGNNINTSWWDDCAANLDTKKIQSCARGQEGISLLRENINLNKELGVMFGPTYLLDNQEIFATKGVPSKEELKKIITR